MNPNPTSPRSSTDTSAAAETISRRAYELWEQEGRPDGSDLRHWLQAEQELSGGGTSDGLNLGRRPGSSNGHGSSGSDGLTSAATDVRPLQGTRAAAAQARDAKRTSEASPAGRTTVGASRPTSAGRRK